MNIVKENLRKPGYDFAVEILDGKWNEVLPSNEPLCSAKAIAELRRRCPGFSDKEYSDAIYWGWYNASR